MSKQIRLQAIALLTVILILTVASPRSFVARAQAQSAAAIPTREARNAAVVEATEAVLKETSELRQLPILRPVKSGTQSREEIQRFLIIRLLTEQVAGYYDPRQQEFFLADWIDLDGQQPVMAHELTHALQDQHFNLRRFEKWPKGDSDAELAAHALVEGDASLAMAVYVSRSPARILSLMKSMGTAGKSATEEIDRAPRAIRESLLFPYEKGMQWAQALHKRDGWSLVSKAYTDLPQSTEQILHAEKYFAREAPIKVNLPDISSKLGSGWKRIDTDVNGEWSYYLILDEYLKSSQDSKRAAAGWGGDRYSVYEGAKPGSVAIIQLSAWDTRNDAVEFFDAYVKRTERRYAGATPISTIYTDTLTDWNNGRAWRTNEGLVIIIRQLDRVGIIEGLPENADLKKVMDAVWGKELMGSEDKR